MLTLFIQQSYSEHSYVFYSTLWRILFICSLSMQTLYLYYIQYMLRLIILSFPHSSFLRGFYLGQSQLLGFSFTLG